MVTPDEVKRGSEAYRAHEPREAMYRTARFLVEHFRGRPREMADGMGVLLLTWNQACYRYGSFDFDLLEQVLRKNMATIEALRDRDILYFQETDAPVIEQLFLALLEALRVKEGKRKRSPVAVSKALHLLAPGFFPAWDAEIAMAYGCPYQREPSQKYLAFTFKMRELASQLQEHAHTDPDRTLLKLIDEYNYAKYTKGWI